MKSPAALTIVLAAACGGPGRATPTAPGCPPAIAVAYADWHERLVVGTPPPGLPAEAAWLVRLGQRPLTGDGALAPGPLAAYEVAKLGMGPLPDDVWVMAPGASKPCRARVAGYAAERFEDVAIIDAIVTGCPGPAAAASAPIAWIGFGGEPGTCHVVDAGREVAAPGELPAIWEPAAPAATCPGCDERWAADTVAGVPAITAIAITDVTTVDGRTCYEDGHSTYGLWATPKDGAPVALAIPGQPALQGALVDERGVRVVLTTTDDGWGTYDVDGEGRLTGGRAVQFLAEQPGASSRALAEPCTIW